MCDKYFSFLCGIAFWEWGESHAIQYLPCVMHIFLKSVLLSGGDKEEIFCTLKGVYFGYNNKSLSFDKLLSCLSLVRI